MKTMSVREFRQQTPHLKATLAVEGEVLLVSNGEPIARILPIVPPERPKLPSMKALRDSMSLSDVTAGIRRERDLR